MRSGNRKVCIKTNAQLLQKVGLGAEYLHAVSGDSQTQKTRRWAGLSELLAADVAAVLLAAQARYATSCSGTLHGKGLVVRG